METNILGNVESYAAKGFGRYAVHLKSNNKLVGMCGFLKNQLRIALGYRYSRDTWRQGIGTEAAKSI